MATPYSRYFTALDDYNASQPIDDRDIDGEYDQIKTYLNRKVVVQGSAPSSPTNGDTWVDSTNKRVKFYRTSEWVEIAVFVAAASSGNPSGISSYQEGDLWFDTTNNLLKAYDGSAWNIVGGSSTTPSTVQGDVLYASGTNTLAALAKSTTSKHYLSNQGTSNNPSWAKIDLAAGIEIASEAQGDILYRGASNWARLGAGTSGQVLKTNGAGANPSWTDDGTYPYAAGSDIIASADTERTITFNSDASYTKVKEFFIPRAGTLTISFDMKWTSGGGAYVKGRIYRNGVAVGTERTDEAGSYVTFTENISGWSAGDKCQLYCGAQTTGVAGAVKNFRLKATIPSYEFILTDAAVSI